MKSREKNIQENPKVNSYVQSSSKHLGDGYKSFGIEAEDLINEQSPLLGVI